MSSNVDEEGLTDSAVLLMTIGEEECAEVFKHLSPKEVQRLGETMAKLKTVQRERVDQVIARFATDAATSSSLVSDTDEFVRSVLNRALGEEKASLLVDRILQGRDVSGIESLKWMDAGSVAELVRNEHPQIIASILVHLDRDHASGILNLFTDRLRNEVVMRIATLDGIQPLALKELNDVLSRVLQGGDRLKKASLGGVKTTAEILNFLGSSSETAVLDAVREADPDLAQKIMDQMFTFDDVNKLDDRGIQTLLREVSTESLVVALKGADEELKEKILRNMSTRAAESLREEMENKGPVRVSEVESEQKEILKTVRRLADEGQIQLSSGSDDEFV
ncbi:flagellar motor switch protein FliG [Piscinibacterium candidicorallinum]|jgi:flagellar motor switch protein FliG|uniref:Flagellar motor switch protein FliG n=1 Tax=Piscinibacterium candidicorallinum TaxID=1793872 RepID=A0ABV7H9Z4_9BURK